MSLLTELNRRNVTRVAIAYAVAGWVITEVASVVLSAFSAPEWVLQVLIILLAIGFPLALIFSWVYELTPEGLKKESEIAPEQSVTGHTAKKLNLVVIVLLVIAIGLVLFDRLLPGTGSRVSEPAAMAAVSSPGQESTPSVAVLAFENMSADADNEYFADGISEEILNLLADVSDLSVASRTSAFAFKGKELPIPEIARALNVRYVLEGSVRKAGDQVRVTAQLIDAETDRHLWSETFDRALRDIFSIQDEIAAAIGAALQVELLGEGGAAVKAEAIDPEVYNHFLEARFLMRKRNPDDVDAGNRLLIDVVAAEPRFARAHVLLGEAYLLNQGLGRGVGKELTLKLANMHASLARSLNPDLGGIEMILGNIAGERKEFVLALEHYRRAIEMEPMEPRPYHWRGFLYSALGYPDLCAADMERALELDSQNPNVHYALAGCLMIRGDYDRVIELATRGATLGNPGGYSLVVIAEHQRGNRAEALRHLQYYLDELGAEDEGWGVLRAIWEGNQPESALTEADLESMENSQMMLLENPKWVLERLGVDDPGNNDISQMWIKNNTRYRQDSRFIDMLERMGILSIWREIGPPPDCRAEGESFTCGHGLAN